MTSSRIYKPTEATGPGPQGYDVRSKLTNREKYQNDLLSQRYKNWHKKHQEGGTHAIGQHINELHMRIDGRQELQI